MPVITETAEGVQFNIRVLPRSSRCEFVGVQDGSFKFKITAPPVEGKANTECIKFISNKLGVKRARVNIVSGHRSKNKRVAVSGATIADVENAFNPTSESHK